MIEKITLQAEGFQFSFEVDYGRTDQEYVGMIVSFQLVPHLQSMSIHSDKTSISVKDLQRLIEYFEQHVAHIQDNPSYNSDVFLNWELGFQLQALAGEIDSLDDEEGYFDIMCLVNVGDRETRVYAGGESNVTLKDAKAFTETIKALLEELSTYHPVVVYDNSIRPTPPIRE